MREVVAHLVNAVLHDGFKQFDLFVVAVLGHRIDLASRCGVNLAGHAEIYCCAPFDGLAHVVQFKRRLRINPASGNVHCFGRCIGLHLIRAVDILFGQVLVGYLQQASDAYRDIWRFYVCNGTAGDDLSAVGVGQGVDERIRAAVDMHFRP